MRIPFVRQDKKKTAGRKKKKKKKTPAESQGSAPPKTPAPLGTTSGVGINETWIRVFEENEKTDEKNRLTDEKISQFMKSEFPDLDAKIFDRIEIARNKYNRGGFHKKDKSGKVVRPKIHSRPYAPQDGSTAASRAPLPKADAVRKSSLVKYQKDFKAHKK